VTPKADGSENFHVDVQLPPHHDIQAPAPDHAPPAPPGPGHDVRERVPPNASGMSDFPVPNASRLLK